MRRFVFALLFFVTVLSGCTKKSDISFGSSEDNPLAYIPGIEWAVVKDPLAGFRETDDYGSKVLTHARRGDVLEVTGKRISTRKNSDGKSVVVVWYGFDIGWVESSSVYIYDNKMKAENASKKMTAN